MPNSKTNLSYNPSASHRGAALIIAMIVLVLLTILGLAGMSSSSMELKMSSNLQQQTVSFQNSENGRTFAERLIRTSFINWMDVSGNPTTFPATAGYYNIFGGTAVPDIASRTFWSTTANSMDCAGNRCTIEYLGRQMVFLDNQTTSANQYVFRITTYGKSTDGTDSIVQAVFLVT